MYPLHSHCRFIQDWHYNFNSNQFNVSQIRDNIIFLGWVNNWNVLVFKEALMIKKHGPSINCGLKTSEGLQLFFNDLIAFYVDCIKCWLHFNNFIWHLIYSFSFKLIYSLFNVKNPKIFFLLFQGWKTLMYFMFNLYFQ